MKILKLNQSDHFFEAFFPSDQMKIDVAIGEFILSVIYRWLQK